MNASKSKIKSLIREILIESLFGSKVTLVVGKVAKLPALISKNTRPGEESYRFTWFVNGKEGLSPGGHIALDKEEMHNLISTKKFTSQTEADLQRNFLIGKVPMSIDLTAPKLTESLMQLNESMNVMVSGANYERTDRLDSLANQLLSKVVSPIINNLPQDQQNYFRKNSVGFYNLLVPDGSYYSQANRDTDPNTGVLNLYTSGLTSQTLQVVIKAIFDELRKMGVKWKGVKKEDSKALKSQVIRIPVITNNSTYSGPPELNMSNRNAIHMFKEVLQYEIDDYSFTLDAKELKERIESIKNDPTWLKGNTINTTKNEPTIDPTDPTLAADYWKDKDEPPKSGGATIINMGVDEPYLEERLNQILEIAEWAIKNNHKTITVG